MQAENFTMFAEQWGGLVNPSAVFTPESGMAWLTPIISGLGQLLHQYQGDKNRRGDVYHVQHGLIDRMDINGVADRTQQSQVFGITLGATLRLSHVHRLLLLASPETRALDLLHYLLAASADDPEPDDAYSLSPYLLSRLPVGKTAHFLRSDSFLCTRLFIH